LGERVCEDFLLKLKLEKWQPKEWIFK
jgi:hypothetical protein